MMYRSVLAVFLPCQEDAQCAYAERADETTGRRWSFDSGLWDRKRHYRFRFRFRSFDRCLVIDRCVYCIASCFRDLPVPALEGIFILAIGFLDWCISFILRNFIDRRLPFLKGRTVFIDEPSILVLSSSRGYDGYVCK